MKHKKQRGKDSILFTFGERSEAKKISYFEQPKSNTKLYKALTRTLYKKDKLIRNINIRVEGGYSKTSI